MRRSAALERLTKCPRGLARRCPPGSFRSTLFGLCALALAGALSVPARAGIVYLMNDEEIEGEILDVGVDYVVIRVPGGRQSIPLREVRDVEFRPGELLWEKKFKSALQRAKEQREAEIRAKRGVDIGKPGAQPDAPPIAVGNLPNLVRPEAKVDTSRFGGRFQSDRYQFSVRYPTTFRQTEPEVGFLTFHDDSGGAAWSFNITYFDAYEDGDYEVIRSRNQAELARIPHYTTRTRALFAIGSHNAERTTGLYERAGRAIRHDQVVVQTRRGILVVNFFSPGATFEDNAVPDVEAVISSIDLS